MIKNYLKIALRNLLRKRGYTFINIFGLTAGISISTLLIMFVWDETTYDKFHNDSDRIFRIVEKLESPEGNRLIGRTAVALGSELPNLAGVELTASFYQPWGHANVFIGDERYLERSWMIASDEVFKLFKFEFIEGSAEASIKKPGVIISSDAALRFFGSTDAVGKIIEERNFGDLEVTAVYESMPSNSHLLIDLIFPMESLPQELLSRLENWNSYGAYTYLKATPGTSVENLETAIEEIAAPHWEDNPARGGIWLQPLTDIYFGSKDVEFGPENAKGEKFYVYLIATIAIFIIVLACINYVNLATARASHRSREIGMRKVNGAHRWQLITQFLGESFILAIIAFLLSIGILDLLMVPFNTLTEKSFTMDFGLNPELWFLLFATSVFVGLASGIYPAVYLSKLKPANSLKGIKTFGQGGLFVRKGLVIFQFFISITMLISTLIISRQMNFISEKEVGFDKENMLVIDINSGSVRRSFEAMKQEFSKIRGVTKVATSSRVPGEWKGIPQVVVSSPNSQADSLNSYYMCFDTDVLNTFDLELIAGRNFSDNPQADSLSVILNETAVRQLGWKDPIDNEIYVSFRETSRMRVIGVVKDFNFQSLHDEVQPLVISSWLNPVTVIDYFSLKLNTENFEGVIDEASKVHAQFDQATSMEYHFLDQQLDQFYKAELRQAKVFSFGSILAIIIACLGLLGLASYMMELKLKEIGVRKVLGASEGSLFLHFNKTFMVQIAIAFILAVPVSYYLMNEWLNYFAYKIELNPLMFLGPGIAGLFIAILVASYHVLRASTSSPVEILKTD